MQYIADTGKGIRIIDMMREMPASDTINLLMCANYTPRALLLGYGAKCVQWR